MAHSCPDCDETCYCGGDIDDMVMDGGKEERLCSHYNVCKPDDPDDDALDDDCADDFDLDSYERQL